MRILRLTTFISILTCLLFIGSGTANAARFIGRGQVNVNKTIHDDVYISGGQVEINNDIDGDVMVVSGNVRINGDIRGDLFVAAGNVFVDGRIGNTVRLVGGSLDIKGQVNRDLMAAGGNIVVRPGTIINGDVVAAGGTFSSWGLIGGDLLGNFGNADLNGRVNGRVKVDVDKLIVSKKARIKGDLIYRSDKPANISPQAKVAGKISRLHPIKSKTGPLSIFLHWLWLLTSMLLIGFILKWLFPDALKSSRDAAADQPWAGLGLGFALIFLIPIALIISMFTIIGIPLALIVLAAYLVVLYLSQIVGAIAIASIILDRMSGERRQIQPAAVAVGIVVLSLLKLVPFLGALVTFLLVLLGTGGMSITVWRRRSNRSSLAPPPPTD